MSNTSWLIVALLIVALTIGAYVWTLMTRRRRLTRKLNELRRAEHDE